MNPITLPNKITLKAINNANGKIGIMDSKTINEKPNIKLTTGGYDKDISFKN
jgi:hypothetical protein